MKTSRLWTVLACAAIMFAVLASGCQSQNTAASSDQQRLLGSPPPAGAAAQIEAAKAAQQKALASHGVTQNGGQH